MLSWPSFQKIEYVSSPEEYATIFEKVNLIFSSTAKNDSFRLSINAYILCNVVGRGRPVVALSLPF